MRPEDPQPREDLIAILDDKAQEHMDDDSTVCEYQAAVLMAAATLAREEDAVSVALAAHELVLRIDHAQ